MILQFDSKAADFEEFLAFSARLHAADPVWRTPTLPRVETAHGRFFSSVDGCGNIRARLYARAKFELDWRSRKLGIIGLYDALQDIRPDHVRELLDAACAYLRAQGCNYVLGPVNGSTWYNYRFALTDDSSPFFLDPCQPATYAAQWLAVGFTSQEHYMSYAIERQDFQFGRLQRFNRQLARKSIELQDVQPENLEQLLPEIHRLSMRAFVNNPLFSPLSLEDFICLYRPLQPLLQSRWQVVARNHNGDLLGFIFAVPDVCNRERRALVIKTVAVAPVAEARGLGAGLAVLLHHRAWQDNYQRIYHALMHDANSSSLINAAGARIHRRYALLGKALTGAT